MRPPAPPSHRVWGFVPDPFPDLMNKKTQFPGSQLRLSQGLTSTRVSDLSQSVGQALTTEQTKSLRKWFSLLAALGADGRSN
jgi:hypothetical protein